MTQHRFAAVAAATFLLVFAGTSSAQTTQTTGTNSQAQQPRITALEVNSDAGLQPGAVLQFRLAGTPKGTAKVQVAGSQLALTLQETQPGAYTGRYTIRRDESGLTPSSLIRSQLTVGGNTQTVDFSFPASFGSQQAAGSAKGFRIDSFTSPLVDKPLPGTELRFTVEGSPGAKASVQVPGLSKAVELREERPGRYTGTYVLRRGDTVKAGPAVATLRSGNQTATAQLGHSLSGPTAAASQPVVPLTLKVTQPQNGISADVPQLTVQGTTAPEATVKVRVETAPPAKAGQASVAQTMLQTSVKADAKGHFTLPLSALQRPATGSRVDIVVEAELGKRDTRDRRVSVIQR